MNAETSVPYRHWNNDWDGAALVVATKASMQGQDITQNEKWALSPDGKTLALDRMVGFGGQNMSIKISFNKQ